MSDSLSSFEWIQFLDLAKDLHHSTTEDSPLAEAKYRTVIGRAYYAVFNVAKEYLESQGIRLPRGSSAHEEVRNHFDNQNFSTVADNLDNLRKLRNHADYKNKPGKTIDWKKQSESAIEVANEIVDAVKAIKLLDKKKKPILKPKK
ncbi:MAG: hypothetical protein RLZZ04_2904 [Cyanobacteriota bacterium]|jgi:uncharacterized protein (UPF0332 family)